MAQKTEGDVGNAVKDRRRGRVLHASHKDSAGLACACSPCSGGSTGLGGVVDLQG